MLAATVLLFVCCDKENLVSQRNGRDISFYACVAGTGTEQLTKADVICSDADTLPLTWTITDGIVGQTAPGTQTLTKGALINNGTVAEQLGSAYSFQLVSWTGSTQFYPTEGVATISYNSSKWQPSSGNSPQWPESGDVTFYAVANLPSSGASWTNTSNTSANLTYTVPASASAQNDILMGYYKGQGNNGTAELTFYHPLTAVVFKKGAFDNASSSIEFKKITLSGVYESGTATQEQSAGGSVFSWTPGANTTTVELLPSGDYISVNSTSNVIGEPFLLIPQSLTSSSSVTITVNATVDGVDAVFAKTLTSGEWQAGKTNIYTLGFENNFLSVKGSVAISFNAVTGSNSYSVSATGPWKLQYKNSGGSWTDAASNTIINDWVQFDKVSGVAGDDIAVTATISPATDADLEYETITVAHDEILRNNASKGTEELPYDLSMNDIYGAPRSSATTANCYVINAPGWYAFPLVYGNAIKNGEVNTSAYNPNNATLSPTYLPCFLNAYNECITSPFIEEDLESHITTPLTAAPLWEDVEDFGIIPESACSVLTQSEAKAKGLSCCGDNCGYVMFQVSNSTLTQGNVLLALYNGEDIVWNWHIWVTDEDLTCKKVTNASGTQLQMMKYNLGWVESNNAYKSYVDEKSLDIRFVLTDGEGSIIKEGEPLAVTRERYDFENASVAGSNPTYQWGRKDPFIRGDFSAAGSITELTSGNYSCHGITEPFSGVQFGKADGIGLDDAIKYPYKFYLSNKWENATYWYFTDALNPDIYNNLWSASSVAYGDMTKPVKTIYDPCPPGFQVPQRDAFSGFGTSIHIRSMLKGADFYTDNTNTEIIYMPIAGYRYSPDNGFLYNDYDYYWTAVPMITSSSDGTRQKPNGLMMYLAKYGDWWYCISQEQFGASEGCSIRPVKE